jgi:hypothetical protein
VLFLSPIIQELKTGGKVTKQRQMLKVKVIRNISIVTLALDIDTTDKTLKLGRTNRKQITLEN